MGTATTVAQFVSNIDDLGHRIAAPNKRAANEAGDVFGEIIDREADRAGATSWAGGKRPRYRVRQRGTEVFIRPSNVGAVVALNDGTQPHIIGARGLGTKRGFQKRARGIAAVSAFGSATGMVGARRNVRNGKQALMWGGAAHPTPFAFVSGTRGFGFVGKATPKATEAAAEVWLAVKRRELLKGGR